MNVITRYLLVHLMWGLFFLPANAIGNTPQLSYLGIEQGLSNNAVTCILQDHYGFMWMGTYNGLNRYDSANFIIYNNSWNDPSSLVSNHITHLAEDKLHRIWVGTQKGVVYFCYTDAKFHPVFYASAKPGKKIKLTSNINGLVSDRHGRTYIATDDHGLLVHDAKAGLAKKISLAGKPGNYNVQAIMLDEQDKAWLFVKDVGLCSYTARTNQVNIEYGELITAYCLKADKHNNIWIGTEAGLYQYSRTSGQMRIYNSSAEKLSSNNIKNLFLGKSDQLWIATDGGGINILDLKAHRITYMLPGETAGLLKSGAISDIYEDRESRIWIATLRGGVSIIDHKLQGFELVRHDPLNKNSLINNFVLSFCEDENSNLWIGTDGGGLSFWDRKKKTYRSFLSDKGDPESLSSNFIVSILKDSSNEIWVATFSGGIDLYQKATGKFKHYNCYNTAKKNFENNLWKLFEDREHHIWAGTTRDGALYLYNRRLDKFELFDQKLTNIHTLCEDRAGILWAGDYSRLIKIDRLHKKHVFIPVNSAIRSMLEDRHGNFWIGTEGGGLLLFDRRNNTFKRYTDVNGLPGNSVLNLLEDNSGRIWLSTFNGISVFDTVSGKFRNYVTADGLQSNQFNYNAALKLGSGELLFGGIRGFNRFDPEHINSGSNHPQLRITGLKVNNVPIEERREYLDGTSLVSIKGITIPYNQATLAIDYVALEYSFPEKISYAYFLEGWDRSWNEVGKTKTAYYSRLNPGKYILQIKSTGSDGNWLPPKRIYITILSPWYLTWWALPVAAMILVVIMYLIRQNRIKQIRLKYEVTMANSNMEKEKELNEKKLSFFTNISHEFRTPLTLIINPIKDLLTVTDGQDKPELNTIYRNARRLLGLVDQLLLFRRAETEQDQLHVVKNDFRTLSNDVFSCFVQQAKIKNIMYHFICDEAEVEVYGDREKIEIALFNLISNAFTFTLEGGHITVSVYTAHDNVYFKIDDDGTGIPEDMSGKIFDKFYQGKSDGNSKTGFGIGLYLAKTFMEQHGGKLNYSAAIGGGMTFILELKKGRTHFTASQLSVDGLQQYVTGIMDQEIPEPPQTDESLPHLELMISNEQTVLIVDQDEEIRRYINQIFRGSYATLEAGDGNEGLLLVRKALPDIIISEVAMPGMSGIELCRSIKQDSSLSHIPVILLTGDYGPELRLKAIEAGAVDFIGKPFEKDLLIARVNGILKIKEELQHYFYSEITQKTDTRSISELHKDFLYQCIAIIESSLQDQDFDVHRIAREMGMSYSSLLKKIKAMTGQSLNGFIRFVRLRKAAELMIQTNCNVNEAAMQVGINDIKYFRAQFYKLFGINPSDFIKKHRKAFQKSYHFNKRQYI